MATTAVSLKEFQETYGRINTRVYRDFVAIVCINAAGQETFINAPNPEGQHKMEGYPYGTMDQNQVVAFLKAHKNELRVIDGESAALNTVHTLCFGQDFPDTTADAGIDF